VRPANPSIVKDILAFVIGIIVMGIVGYIHTLLGYFPYG
jgi:preprotein translocase subunit Sss1